MSLDRTEVDENGMRGGDAGKREASLPSRFVFSPLAEGRKPKERQHSRNLIKYPATRVNRPAPCREGKRQVGGGVGGGGGVRSGGRWVFVDQRPLHSSCRHRKEWRRGGHYSCFAAASPVGLWEGRAHGRGPWVSGPSGCDLEAYVGGANGHSGRVSIWQDIVVDHRAKQNAIHAPVAIFPDHMGSVGTLYRQKKSSNNGLKCNYASQIQKFSRAAKLRIKYDLL